jgi:hypothetical protein
MPNLTLDDAIDRIQAHYDKRCASKGYKHALLEVIEAVENPKAEVFIVRISERCLSEFGKRHHEIAVDSKTGELRAIHGWTPRDVDGGGS